MGIYPVGHISGCMAQDMSFCILISPGVIQQGRYGMPAVVGGVLCVDGRHDVVPQSTKPAVIIRSSRRIRQKVTPGRLHPSFYKRENPAVYRDNPYPGSCLAFGYSDEALT